MRGQFIDRARLRRKGGNHERMISFSTRFFAARMFKS